MKQAYIISRGTEEFASAREQFAWIVDRLQPAAVLSMEHGEVLISREGTELMRRLLQWHLDVRAAAETREAGVRGADGVVRSHVREGCRRRLGTIFGEVEVRRCGYSAPEEGSLFPLDGELNLPKDSHSHGLRERLAVEVARDSFDEAVRAIETTTGGQVPKRQAEELAAKVSQDFEAFYQHRASRGPEETRDPCGASYRCAHFALRAPSPWLRSRPAHRQSAGRRGPRSRPSPRRWLASAPHARQLLGEVQPFGQGLRIGPLGAG